MHTEHADNSQLDETVSACGLLETAKALDDAHRMQCTNYLKATDLQPSLLLNFGKSRLEIKQWPMAYEPRRGIRVFCVNHLSASMRRRHGLVCVEPPPQRAWRLRCKQGAVRSSATRRPTSAPLSVQQQESNQARHRVTPSAPESHKERKCAPAQSR
jgi:PD-(D/E)XK nuclease superfamily